MTTIFSPGVNLERLASASTARTNLGVAIGSDVQAYDADLAAIADLAATGLIARTGAGTVDARTITLGSSLSGSNLDGVGGNPTLDAIQGIRTNDTPQFSRLGIGGAAHSGVKLVVNGTRTLHFDTENAVGDGYGNRFYGSAGGWITDYGFRGSSGTYLGGFGAYGVDDALFYHWVGASYSSPTMNWSPTEVGIGDGKNVTVGGTTGTKLGTSATAQKLSFFNAPPIVQPTAAGQAALAAQGQQALTDSTAGTAGTTLAAVTGTVYATDVATIRDWIASLAAQLALVKTDVANLMTLVDAQRTAMVNFGSMKGS